MRTPVQKLLYAENIRRIKDMLLESNTDPMDIEDRYENDIDTTKICTLRASITNIERRTSTAHTDLCTWRASNTRARRQEEAKSVFTHIESSYDALSQEITQYGDYLIAEDHVISKGLRMEKP